MPEIWHNTDSVLFTTLKWPLTKTWLILQGCYNLYDCLDQNFFQYHSDHICNQAAKIYHAYFQVINKWMGLFGMYSFYFSKLPETFSSFNTFF